ncbi:hypothetical protein RKD54_001962 [Pseudarthrobacter sp. SLBN-100]
MQLLIENSIVNVKYETENLQESQILWCYFFALKNKVINGFRTGAQVYS